MLRSLLQRRVTVLLYRQTTEQFVISEVAYIQALADKIILSQKNTGDPRHYGLRDQAFHQ